MEIEVVEFYPYKREGSSFSGSLHVYIVDLCIDLRGIFVSYDKKRVRPTNHTWIFRLPSKKTFSESDKKEVFYPVFQFSDKKKNLELLKEIRKQGKPYIQKNYLGLDIKTEPRKERKTYEDKNQSYKKQDDRPLWKKPIIPKYQGLSNYRPGDGFPRKGQ